MSEPNNRGRMLLSHNFDLYHNELPALNREQFARVFIEGLSDREELSCNLIENPHWIVEIIFSTAAWNAQKLGQVCGEVLAARRQQDFVRNGNGTKMPDILLLGGKKTTPAWSPTSLQPGEWGVDVVETNSAASFLANLGWSERISSKPADAIFKVELNGQTDFVNINNL